MASNKEAGGFGYLLSFGSNLGNREQNMHVAFQKVAVFARALAFSKVIETQPLESPIYTMPPTTLSASAERQRPYLNAVALVESKLEPNEFYRGLSKIEDDLGHDRHAKWQPRHMDIDILLGCHHTGSEMIFELGKPVKLTAPPGNPITLPGSQITLPHPELCQRAFLLYLLVDDLRISRACLKKHGILFPE